MGRLDCDVEPCPIGCGFRRRIPITILTFIVMPISAVKLIFTYDTFGETTIAAFIIPPIPMARPAVLTYPTLIDKLFDTAISHGDGVSVSRTSQIAVFYDFVTADALIRMLRAHLVRNYEVF